MKLLLLSILLLGATLSIAQTNSAAQEQNRILRRQEQEKIELLKRSQNRAKSNITPLDDSLRVDKDAPCFPIQKIELLDATQLSKSEISLLLADFKGKCLGSAHIDQVIRKVTNLYIQKGFISSRVYLAPQDLSSGVLKLKVIEGKIQDITFLKGDKKRKGLNSVVVNKKDKLLNLRDLEQGIDQINRLRTLEAQMKLIPASEAGYSIVEIPLYQNKKIYSSISADNYGFQSTGQEQGEFVIGSDDLFGLFENLHLSIKNDLEFGIDSRSNSGYIGMISIPWGYWNFNLSGSYFKYKSNIETPVQSFESSGKSDSLRFEIERVVFRDQDRKSSLALSLETKDSRNFIDDIFLSTTSRRLSIINARFSHEYSINKLVGSLSLQASYGTKLFGALEDTSNQGPQAQFKRYSINSSLLYPFNIKAQSLHFSINGNYQWTPETLYGTERQSIGGIYSVRGFREEGISGDRGGFIRAELNYNLPQTLQTKLLGAMSIYTAYDMGWIDHDKSQVFERGHLQGAALGLRANNGYVFFDLGYEIPINASSFIRDESDIFRVKLGVNI